MIAAAPRRRRAATAAATLVGTIVASLLVACSSSADSSAPTGDEISTVLSSHAQAVRSHDRAAFEAGIDPDARARTFRAGQLQAFTNLASVPLTRWSYARGPQVRDTGAQAAVRRTYGPSALIVRVTLRYALRGVDQLPTSHDLWWTLARVDGRVVIASDSDLANAGGVSWKGPWDYGVLRVVHGRAGLVFGHPDHAALLRPIADAVDEAVPAVTAVWGSNWSRDVAVVVPSSAAERSAALGPEAQGPADVAAVATSDGQDPLTGKVYGQRLVVDAATASRLSAVGRRIVITHEVTHIATAAATTNASPRWLVEGFADYVGNLHSGQSVGFAAGELRADVRRGRAPTSLPVDADFEATSTAAQAYEGSWLACRLVAAKAGTAGLVRFYRLVGASPQTADTAVAAALRTVLHETPTRFVAQWRAYVQAELGR